MSTRLTGDQIDELGRRFDRTCGCSLCVAWFALLSHCDAVTAERDEARQEVEGLQAALKRIAAYGDDASAMANALTLHYDMADICSSCSYLGRGRRAMSGGGVTITVSEQRMLAGVSANVVMPANCQDPNRNPDLEVSHHFQASPYSGELWRCDVPGCNAVIPRNR